VYSHAAVQLKCLGSPAARVVLRRFFANSRSKLIPSTRRVNLIFRLYFFSLPSARSAKKSEGD